MNVAFKPTLRSLSVELSSMSIDQLWSLHEEITRLLSEKIKAQKAELELRLAVVLRQHVEPKFRNPKNPSQTWSGLGRRPHWLHEELRAGRDLEDFLIGLREPA